jgi:hypothetical protein
MGNLKRLGNFEDQTGEKKRLVWLGKQPIFGLYKEGYFGLKSLNFSLLFTLSKNIRNKC